MIVLIVRRTYTNSVCKKMIGFKLPEYEMNQLIKKEYKTVAIVV